MTPGARHQKAIDILDSFWTFTDPLDRFVRQRFQESRYMGSSDRRAVQALIYTLLRQRQNLLDKGAVTTRQELLLSLKDQIPLETIEAFWNGQRYNPSPLTSEEQSLWQAYEKNPEPNPWGAVNTPPWIYELAALTPDLWQALNQQAPVDIWVNPLRSTKADLMNSLNAEGYEFQNLESLGQGLRTFKATGLDQTSWYKQGYFEFQDAGSQSLCQEIPHTPGKILDLCAGAGGKSLNLGACLPISTVIVTTDMDPKRLERAAFRINRTGLQDRIIFIDYPAWPDLGPYEVILLDVPCSGTGTWRRHPENRWRLTPEKLIDLQATQLQLLTESALHLKPGGWIAYGTCSVLPQENEHIIQTFLNDHPHFKESKRVQWTPDQHQTDGFFLSIVQLVV